MTNSMSEECLVKCDICGEYHEKKAVHKLEIKGKEKKICQGCADTIHGLV